MTDNEFDFKCDDCGKIRNKLNENWNRIERTLQCKDGFILEEEIDICEDCIKKRKAKAKPIMKVKVKK